MSIAVASLQAASAAVSSRPLRSREQIAHRSSLRYYILILYHFFVIVYICIYIYICIYVYVYVYIYIYTHIIDTNSNDNNGWSDVLLFPPSRGGASHEQMCAFQNNGNVVIASTPKPS